MASTSRVVMSATTTSRAGGDLSGDGKRASDDPLAGLPAQEENRLLAEQVPEPPRRIEADALALGVERDALLDVRVDLVAEDDEVADGAEVDVGRVVPGIGQAAIDRHAAGEGDQ